MVFLKLAYAIGTVSAGCEVSQHTTGVTHGEWYWGPRCSPWLPFPADPVFCSFFSILLF